MKKRFIQGLIKRHPDGFGFLLPDDKTHPDVYIPHHSMTGVMSNDRVLAEVEPERGNDRFRGEIIRVVQRGLKKVVGHYTRLNDQYGMIKDEGHGWGTDLRIALEKSMDAKNGFLVAAEILTYPGDGEKFTGQIVEIIGDIEDPLNDIRRVVHGNNIPEEFPPDVIREASVFTKDPEEKDFAGRKDLRGKSLITIDGVTAKDFDDAVLVETTEKGFRLYVAIADVSHYVRVGGAIDREAYQRGTSVYFPNFVIPMLPENLSNGLCSLNPHVPRLCLVAEMLFDFTGTMIESEFYEAVMESKARVTYGQAQEVVDGTQVPSIEHVRETILRCADLAKILMAKRFRDGSLDLEIPETQLQIDGGGRPVDVIRSERLFAHRLIEELMLAANVAVATFLAARTVPALYRIHEPPNEIAIRLLERYMEAFGGKTKLGDGKLQKRLTKALEEFEGKPEALVLHILTLRSMSQAKYNKDNVGHFGLGFEFYTHFTSPIRRYPDLIVHRLIKNQILPNSGYRLMSLDDLTSAGAWLSGCEQRSVKAERQLMAIKKARFMQQFVGKEFEGMVSSVTKFGAFVLLREYDIDGLIRLEELSGNRWEFDEERLCLVAKGSGKTIKVGDMMKVVVAAADPSTGQVSFASADALAKKAQKPLVVGTTERPLREAKGKTPWRGQERRRGNDRRREDENVPRRRERNDDTPEAVRVEKPDTSPGRFVSRKQGLHFPSKSAKAKPKENDKPYKERSRKLQFADRTKLRFNQDQNEIEPPSESSRKNPEKRGKTADDRGSVRKTRISQSGRKDSAGPVSGRKAQRKRRNR